MTYRTRNKNIETTEFNKSMDFNNIKLLKKKRITGYRDISLNERYNKG